MTGAVCSARPSADADPFRIEQRRVWLRSAAPSGVTGSRLRAGHAVLVSLSEDLRLRVQRTGSGTICGTILAALPTWFGIPEAVEEFVGVSDRSPTVIASLGDQDVGLLTLVIHTPHAAEAYVMGVLPQYHRQGIGRALLGHAEGMLAADGVEFLQVKTLGPSKPDEGYETTRAFYFAYGFRPLEELPDLWDPGNPALQMIKVITGVQGQTWNRRTADAMCNVGEETLTDGDAMNGDGEPKQDVGMTTLLVGALTGQYEFSEADRQAVAEWMVDHAAAPDVRDLLTKIVRTQISDTSEFRVKVAEAIRERFAALDASD